LEPFLSPDEQTARGDHFRLHTLSVNLYIKHHLPRVEKRKEILTNNI